MTFEVLLKQIVKEAVIEALQETKVKSTEEPKNWTTNDEPVKTTLQAPAPLEDVEESDEDVAVEETEISEVDLGSMKLKELREYAEELGINSKGKRAELEERIQEFLNSEESEEEDLDEEPEDDVEESEEVEDESYEDDSEEEDSDEDDEKYAQVKEYVENASDEEIKETLKELGLSTKGKREALIEKLYQAVKDGLFEFVEEDEDAEGTEDVEDIEEESEDMTSERVEGIEELEEKVRADFESGDLTRKDMTTYLKQVGVAVTKKVDDDDVLEMYISKMALLVDDEGEFHEEGEDPYTVNGVPYCCGAKLEVLKDGGYKCNVCGAEYDDDEE